MEDMTSSYDQLEGGQMIWLCASAIGRIVHSRNRDSEEEEAIHITGGLDGE